MPGRVLEFTLHHSKMQAMSVPPALSDAEIP